MMSAKDSKKWDNLEKKSTLSVPQEYPKGAKTSSLIRIRLFGSATEAHRENNHSNMTIASLLRASSDDGRRNTHGAEGTCTIEQNRIDGIHRIILSQRGKRPHMHGGGRSIHVESHGCT